jgi:hypothetical protein
MTTGQKITWRALEYERREQSPNWFWGIGTASGLGIILALIFGNFLLAIILALGAFSLIVTARRGPIPLEYEVNDQGIRAGATFYPYDNLNSFWIETKGLEPKLILSIKRSLMPVIDLPIGPEVSITALRANLDNHLPEVKQEESLIAAVADWLGI